MVDSRKTFINIALILSKHSKCVGAQVGAVIVKDDNDVNII